MYLCHEYCHSGGKLLDYNFVSFFIDNVFRNTGILNKVKWSFEAVALNVSTVALLTKGGAARKVLEPGIILIPEEH